MVVGNQSALQIFFGQFITTKTEFDFQNDKTETRLQLKVFDFFQFTVHQVMKLSFISLILSSIINQFKKFSMGIEF